MKSRRGARSKVEQVVGKKLGRKLMVRASRKEAGHGGWSRTHYNELNRVFQGMEVRDAELPLRLFIKPEDGRGAIRRDERHCVIAQAAQRQVGATAVLVFRTVAYIDLPQEDGTRVVERFLIAPNHTQAIVKLFDIDPKHPLLKATSVLFMAPTPANSLEQKRIYNNRWYRERPKKDKKKTALLRGSMRKKARTMKVLASFGIRSGTGMVHFRTPNIDE